MPPRTGSMDVTPSGTQAQLRGSSQNILSEDLGDSIDTAGGASHRTSSGYNARSSNGGFVSKLYNMIEDGTNTSVIWWSETGDSFMVNPGPDFHNVLATYFKHANPQSFVRQLNMYGFHKVNDVFQGNAGEAHLWEFRHGEGNFSRGSRETLREVRRRPSKHTLDKRDATRVSVPYFGLQTNNVGASVVAPDTVEGRLSSLEHRFYEQHAALKQSEDLRTQMSFKIEALNECVLSCQKAALELSGMVATIAPPLQQNVVLRSVSTLNAEIEQHMQYLQNLDTMQMQADRRQSVASSSWDSAGPMSPFSGPQDDSRRPSIARKPTSRGMASQSDATSHQRLASLSQTAAAPNMIQGRQPSQHAPPPVPSYWAQQEPTADATSATPYIPRRHTSADVRDNPGWRSNFSSSEHLPLPNPNMGNQYSPFGSSTNSGQWPSSPSQHPTQGEQQLRDTLGRYQIDSRNPSTASDATVTQTSYPNPHPGVHQDISQASAGYLQPSQGPFGTVHEGPLFGPQQSHRSSMFKKDIWSNSGASTRRSSMAHILNPADTAERDEEEDVAPDERSKRKRVG